MNIHLQKWAYNILPHHLLSRFSGWVSSIEAPWFRQRLIRWFIAKYGVDMSLAQDPNPDNYTSFNAFFTRHLRSRARPVCREENCVASPADGVISQCGEIQAGQLLQAKGADYSLTSLLAEDGAVFEGGQFMTIYLSPKDYHRVHMPFSGRLMRMTYIPGRLFSVNGFSSTHIPDLFTRNERVVCWFDTALGPMVVILVGAMLVASIHTVWAGQVCPERSREVIVKDYQDQTLYFNKGDELGHFQLGSTVIVCLPKGNWDSMLEDGQIVQMGQALLYK
ncbi:MAG: archaetidylserine decarboxylase, partial [Pseudomonadota bacterium]|nr:archaetidylserine decarboxylase [Pseudomonadota bacterium]